MGSKSLTENSELLFSELYNMRHGKVAQPFFRTGWPGQSFQAVNRLYEVLNTSYELTSPAGQL